VIIGHNARQVQIYAAQQLGLKPSEYRIGKDASSLCGLWEGVLIELEGCKRTTDYYELNYIAVDKKFIKINVPW
jgi:hypothetical protein